MNVKLNYIDNDTIDVEDFLNKINNPIPKGELLVIEHNMSFHKFNYRYAMREGIVSVFHDGFLKLSKDMKYAISHEAYGKINLNLSDKPYSYQKIVDFLVNGKIINFNKEPAEFKREANIDNLEECLIKTLEVANLIEKHDGKICEASLIYDFALLCKEEMDKTAERIKNLKEQHKQTFSEDNIVINSYQFEESIHAIVDSYIDRAEEVIHPLRKDFRENIFITLPKESHYLYVIG